MVGVCEIGEALAAPCVRNETRVLAHQRELERRAAKLAAKAAENINTPSSNAKLANPYQSATDLLQAAHDQIGERAQVRDTEAERSMEATVNSFNAMYGTNLTEEQGWMFMVFLKAARAKGGRVRADDYVDGSAYFALAGETATKSRR